MSGKAAVPNIGRTVELMRRELIKRAERELPEGARRPSESDDAAEAAWLYGKAVGASFAAGGDVIQPGESGDVLVSFFQPNPANPTELLAFVLLHLANYQLAAEELPRIRTESVAWTNAVNWLTAASAVSLDTEAHPRGFPRTWDSPAVRASAESFIAVAAEHIRRLDAAVSVESEFWAMAPEERDRIQIQDVRFWLMQAFKDGEVAELIDDGNGGDRAARIDRVKKARRVEKTKFADARVPYEKGTMAVVRGHSVEAKK